MNIYEKTIKYSVTRLSGRVRSPASFLASEGPN
jgi:hypothetical protein